MLNLRRVDACAVLGGLVIGEPFSAHVLAQATPLGQPADKESGSAAIDPKCEARLKRMDAYPTALPSFMVRATNTLQIVLMSGEKLDFDAIVEEVRAAKDTCSVGPLAVRTRRLRRSMECCQFSSLGIL